MPSMGMLAGSDKARFEKMLSDDPVFNNKYNELSDIKRRIQQLPEIDVPIDFTSNVMQGIEEVNHPWWIRLRGILLRKRSYQISLLGVVSGTAASLASLVLVMTLLWPSVTPQKAFHPDASQHYLMRFSYNNPEARQVYVAGSFNEWRKEQVPLIDSTGSGLWVGMLQIEPGIYEYMFYVDGQWVTDEQAERFKDDGFGRKNAILQLGVDDDVSI
jgi:hypothetical protein